MKYNENSKNKGYPLKKKQKQKLSSRKKHKKNYPPKKSRKKRHPVQMPPKRTFKKNIEI